MERKKGVGNGRRGSISRCADEWEQQTKKQKTVKRNSLAVEILCFLEVFARNLHTHTPSRNESHTHTHTHTHTHARTRAQKYINLKKEVRLVPCLLVQCPCVERPASHMDTTTRSAEKDEVFRPARQLRADLTWLTLNSSWLQQGLTDHRRRIPGRISYYAYTRANC